jgi:hypothetical protein
MKKIRLLAMLLITVFHMGCQSGAEPPAVDCQKDASDPSCKKSTEVAFPAPKNLEAVALDQTSIHLTWDKPDTTKTFSIELQMKKDTETNFTIMKKFDGDVKTFDVNHLAADKTYTFRLRAIADSGTSDYTSEVSEATMSATINSLFPKPTLTATVSAPGTVTLNKTWSNTASTYVTGIQYQMMAEGSYTWTTLGSFSNSVFSTPYTHVPPAGVLQYKITVIYTDGALYAIETPQLVIAKLLAPTNLTGANVDVFGTTKHKINWTYGVSPVPHNGYIIMVNYTNTSGGSASTQITLASNTLKSYTLIPACQSGSSVKYKVQATSSSTLVWASDYSSELALTCP